MKSKRDPKEILAVESTFREWTDLRDTARELSTLRKLRSTEDGFLIVINDEGLNNAEVGLSRREYSAIRRYLIRNRTQALRKLGVDV